MQSADNLLARLVLANELHDMIDLVR